MFNLIFTVVLLLVLILDLYNAGKALEEGRLKHAVMSFGFALLMLLLIGLNVLKAMFEL
jgi:hypothetical protein